MAHPDRGCAYFFVKLLPRSSAGLRQQSRPDMEALLADLRFALRSLKRTPWFTGLAVLILTLGIGANAALFSLLDAVLFKGLPYKDPERLITIEGEQSERSGFPVPFALFEALRDRAATLEAVSIYNIYGGDMRITRGKARLIGRRVSPNFIDMMGVEPLAGHGFASEGDEAATGADVIITANIWQRYLGGDPQALGRTIYLNDVPYTLIGIMPPDFGSYVSGNAYRSDFWITRASNEDRDRDFAIGHEVLARIVPGVTLQDVSSELNSLVATVSPVGWAAEGRRLKVELTKDGIVGESAYPLQLLLAAAGVVLLIACANVAQLMLARSDRRLNEFATRKAIGAGAGRLFRLSLIESLVVSMAGGIGGSALAYWLLPMMVRLAPAEIPRISNAAIDERVLLAAVSLSALAGCLVGMAPALRLSRLSVVEAIKQRSGNASAQKPRFYAALVIVQIASSIALCVMAGLIGRSFLTLLPADPGFESEDRIVHRFTMQTIPLEERVQRLDELMRRLESLPEIKTVAFTTNVPFTSTQPFGDIRDPKGVGEIIADIRVVTKNYFQLMQVPLIEGRLFTDAEQFNGGRVAIVNRTLARKLMPEGDIRGHIIERRGRGFWPEYQIVGVVADSRSSGTSTEIWNEIYIPHTRGLEDYGSLIVQSPLEAGAVDRLLRDELYMWEPETPDIPLFRAERIDDIMTASVAGPRFAATLSSAFSSLALLLAAAGVFGLVSYSVSQRFREFGIRAALGAQPRDLLSVALHSALVSTAIGVFAGLAVTLYLVRFIERFLYSVQAFDLTTFAVVGVGIMSVATISAYLPARRATKINPATTLRYE